MGTPDCGVSIPLAGKIRKEILMWTRRLDPSIFIQEQNWNWAPAKKRTHIRLWVLVSLVAMSAVAVSAIF